MFVDSTNNSFTKCVALASNESVFLSEQISLIRVNPRMPLAAVQTSLQQKCNHGIFLCYGFQRIFPDEQIYVSTPTDCCLLRRGMFNDSIRLRRRRLVRQEVNQSI